MNEAPETVGGELLELWRTAHVELPTAQTVFGDTADIISDTDGFGHRQTAWAELARLYEQATRNPAPTATPLRPRAHLTGDRDRPSRAPCADSPKPAPWPHRASHGPAGAGSGLRPKRAMTNR